MSNLRIISFRIAVEKVAELDQIAKAMDRDRSYLLNEAVEAYLSEQRRPAVLAEKSLGPFLKREPVGDADTGILIDYQKPRKTVAEEIVHSVEGGPKPLPRPVHEDAFEFLSPPSDPSVLPGNGLRNSALPADLSPASKGGKLLVFLSAKGGTGVTTLACNFAVSLVRGSGKKTLLIDLNLPLGDAAINLGIKAEYSTVNALQNFSRLDANFLSGLLERHSSGLSVLAAPTELATVQTSDDAIDKLLNVARQEFDFVVVDAGQRLDLQHTHLFDESATIYLVTQVGIPELRNSNRLINRLTSEGSPKLEIVINRYDPRSMAIDEAHITKALTRPAEWKIPNNYAAVRQMQNSAVSLMEEDSQISRSIKRMTQSVCPPPEPEKKKGFSFFG